MLEIFLTFSEGLGVWGTFSYKKNVLSRILESLHAFIAILLLDVIIIYPMVKKIKNSEIYCLKNLS